MAETIADAQLRKLTTRFGTLPLGELLQKYWTEEGFTSRPVGRAELDHYIARGAVGASVQDIRYDYWARKAFEYDTAGVSGDTGGVVGYWKAKDISGEWIPDRTGRGHDLRLGSVGSSRLINKGAAEYLRLPGAAGNYASVPDAAALDITGDIDIRVRSALDDWTPDTARVLMAKRGPAGNDRSWYLRVDALTGLIRLALSETGGTEVTIPSSVAPTVADGEVLWVRATWRASDGRTQFFTAPGSLINPKETDFVQLGTDRTLTVLSIFVSTSLVEFGSSDAGSAASFVPAPGRFYRGQLFNGINGTKVLDVDFTGKIDGAGSFVCSTGQTVTITAASGADTNDPVFLSHSQGDNYVYQPNTSGNYLSTPDHPSLDIVGDIDIRARISPSVLSGIGANQQIVSKLTNAGNYSYDFYLNNTGFLNFRYSTTGSDLISSASTVSLTTLFSSGQVFWVRATRSAATGNVTFYTAPDQGTMPTVWNQLGAVVGTAAGNMFSGTDNLGIGSNAAGGVAMLGRIYRGQVRDGIDGTVVADFRASEAVQPYTTVTDSVGKVWTFTRAATGRKIALVDRPLLLFGVDDYLEAPDQNEFNFGATDSFTVALAMRDYGTASSQVWFTDTTPTGVGWRMWPSGGNCVFSVQDGTNTTSSVSPNNLQGVAAVHTGVRDVASDQVRLYEGKTLVDSDPDNTTGTLVNANALRVGRYSSSSTNYGDLEFIAAAIIRRALTATEIENLTGELLA